MKTSELLSAIGQVASSVRTPAGAGKVWEELNPWLSKLAINAASKWLPRLTFGFPCQVPVYKNGKRDGECSGKAVSICDVCQSPCCLSHARIDQYGDAICYMCVAEAVQRSRAQRMAGGSAAAEMREQRAKEVAWAKNVLGLSKTFTLDELKKAHRTMSGKWHPDRKKSSRAKASAEQRFKDIQRAFEILKTEVQPS